MHDEKNVYSMPLVKARTMPDMVGPYPVNAVFIALTPVLLSVLTRGAWWPLLLLLVTFPAAWWACRTDVYIVNVLSAGLSIKVSPTRSVWGYSRHVPK